MKTVVVNTIGNIGGFTAPYVLGLIREGPGSVRFGLSALATTLIEALLLFLVRQRRAMSRTDAVEQVANVRSR